MEQAISESRLNGDGAVMRAIMIMGNQRKREGSTFLRRPIHGVNPDRIAFLDSHGTRTMMAACASIQCTLWRAIKGSGFKNLPQNLRNHWLLVLRRMNIRSTFFAFIGNTMLK